MGPDFVAPVGRRFDADLIFVPAASMEPEFVTPVRRLKWAFSIAVASSFGFKKFANVMALKKGE
jgi:hypothetical protein